MARLLFGGIVLTVLITVFTIVDCLRLERSRIRVFPRVAWFLIILLVPIIGAALWFIFGRGSRHRPVRRVVGPDDDPEFLRRVGSGEPQPTTDIDTDARLRELEERLAEVEDDQDPGRTDR